MDSRSYGAVFDTVAVEYDRHRPTYPDVLIDRACEAGGLATGDPVLEVGCGTGQLTRSLVARGLHVTAVEPGQNLIALAGRATSEVQFVNLRFENAGLDVPFAAVFCASAFHWPDPDVSWGKAAQSLRPGGRLALIQYCAVEDESTAEDTNALMGALAEAAPEIAADWPSRRDLETTLSGAEDRCDNVSEVWAWITGKAVARSYAGALFDDAQLAVVPAFIEQTPQELNALFRTTSVYHRLSPSQRNALERANIAIGDRLGRPIRSSMLAVLVSARSVGSAPRTLNSGSMTVNLTRIYTRLGDSGETHLGDMSRVPKTHPRIEAYGTVDELNAHVGLALTIEDLPDQYADWLGRIQNDLFDVGADISVPEGGERERLRVIPEQTAWLEERCDEVNATLEPLKSFVVPGGTKAAAQLHVCRTVCRRAERLAIACGDECSAEVVRYLNRLSDLLFILSRGANGGDEPLWEPGRYR